MKKVRFETPFGIHKLIIRDPNRGDGNDDYLLNDGLSSFSGGELEGGVDSDEESLQSDTGTLVAPPNSDDSLGTLLAPPESDERTVAEEEDAAHLAVQNYDALVLDDEINYQNAETQPVGIDEDDVEEEHELLKFKRLGLSSRDIADFVLFSESAEGRSIERGPIEYRLVLDDINRALGLDHTSPIAATLRVRQMACSANYETTSTALDIPRFDRREDEDTFRAIVTHNPIYVQPILERTLVLLSAYERSSPMERQGILADVHASAAAFAHSRSDTSFAIFGIGFHYDPTIEPSDLSDAVRTELAKFATYVEITLSRKKFPGEDTYGALWRGPTVEPGTRIGFVQGQIKADCDLVLGSRHARHLREHAILIDQDNVHTSNWTRQIVKTTNMAEANVSIAEDGGVVVIQHLRKDHEIFEYVP